MGTKMKLMMNLHPHRLKVRYLSAVMEDGGKLTLSRVGLPVALLLMPLHV